VSLARLALKTDVSARHTMKSLGEIRATLVRTATGKPGRRPTVMLAPELTTETYTTLSIFG
jgi:hypothetical protein